MSPASEPDPKAYIAYSSTSTATVRFRPHNDRSAFAAGTALHAHSRHPLKDLPTLVFSLAEAAGVGDPRLPLKTLGADVVYSRGT
jgi:hypothetical protein